MSCRWATLKAALVERRSKLGESQSLQSVSRDADDIEAWISEKLQTAKDESYKDPSNIQVSFLKHLRPNCLNMILNYPGCIVMTVVFMSCFSINFRVKFKSIKHLKLKLQRMRTEFLEPLMLVEVRIKLQHATCSKIGILVGQK